jgi:hypothetical protein
MGFLTWIAERIARVVADRVIEILKQEHEASKKLSTIQSEALVLVGELDNAQSESEKKAILRKLSNFSDLSRLLLLRDS